MSEAEKGGEAEVQTQEQKDQAAAERYRAQTGLDGDLNGKQGDEPATKAERPDYIPEKFWDAEAGAPRLEDLAKSYAELEKARSKPAEATKEGEGKEGEGEGDGKEGKEGEGGDDIAKTIAAHREKITEKLVAGQSLEDADYAPFEKVGFSRDDIDAFIAGQEALGQMAVGEVHKEVGGEESYKQMVEWARTSFSKEEIEVYDRDIHSADRAVRLTAARGLAARYGQANGKMGRSVTDKGASRGNDAYRSKAEMVTDMKSEQYRKDPAFRKEVERKVQASIHAGIDLRS